MIPVKMRTGLKPRLDFGHYDQWQPNLIAGSERSGQRCIATKQI